MINGNLSKNLFFIKNNEIKKKRNKIAKMNKKINNNIYYKKNIRIVIISNNLLKKIKKLIKIYKYINLKMINK